MIASSSEEVIPPKSISLWRDPDRPWLHRSVSRSRSCGRSESRKHLPNRARWRWLGRRPASRWTCLQIAFSDAPTRSAMCRKFVTSACSLPTNEPPRAIGAPPTRWIATRTAERCEPAGLAATLAATQLRSGRPNVGAMSSWSTQPCSTRLTVAYASAIASSPMLEQTAFTERWAFI